LPSVRRAITSQEGAVMTTSSTVHRSTEGRGSTGDPSPLDDQRPTEVQQLADFIAGARYEDLSSDAVHQLKIRILDTLGVAIGALDAEPVIAIRELLEDLGGTGPAADAGPAAGSSRIGR